MFAKHFSIVFIIIAVLVFLGITYSFNADKEFSYGLDIEGGARLVYIADTSQVPDEEIDERMNALVGVIERRVNAFGVGEPAVYTEQSSVFAGTSENRLVVELPGVTDLEEAIKQIGETPFLEFLIWDREAGSYKSTNINGAQIVAASVAFAQGPTGAVTGEPVVLIEFNSEGGKSFGDLTRGSVGEILGIFLDGVPISEPVIREPILGGTTQISGNFLIDEAHTLANNLNFGALPLPIQLGQTQTIDALLGADTISLSIKAGIIAFFAVILFFILVYRASGVIAILALIAYLTIMFAIFKSLPVVLTAAGLAGFIMSIGFAVDANILIFERMREEFADGANGIRAVEEGFARAWRAIRDANGSSLIIAVLLFWFGTSLVKGFALTFGIGIVISMLTAYLFSRSVLRVAMHKVKKGSKLLI